jgi:hypothetical protein
VSAESRNFRKSFRYQIQDLLLPEFQLVSPEAVVNDWLRSLHAVASVHASPPPVRDYQACRQTTLDSSRGAREGAPSRCAVLAPRYPGYMPIRCSSSVGRLRLISSRYSKAMPAPMATQCSGFSAT